MSILLTWIVINKKITVNNFYLNQIILFEGKHYTLFLKFKIITSTL